MADDRTTSDSPRADRPRVAYVLKRYPRLSETFILGEILALEEAGVSVRIFAAADPAETRVHEAVRRVRARVTYTGGSGAAILREHLVHHNQAAAANPREYDELLALARARGTADAFSEFAQAGWIAALLRRESIAHIHAHFATFAARVACLASRLSGVPFSLTAHAKDLFLRSVDRRVLGDLLGRASFVVAISEFHRHFLLSVNAAARVEVVRNGLDLARIPRNGRRDPGLTPLRILGVGRLVEKKGFDDLVRACALLRDRGVPFECRIVGEGDERLGLEELIRGLDLGGQVRLEGTATQEELFADLARSSVLVAPCVTAASGDRDGLPMVILEGMAAGVPVIATPVTAIPEIVRDGETGLLVPERSPAAIASAVARLRGDPDLGLRLAAAARRAVEERHDAAKSAARLARLFTEDARLPGLEQGASS